VEWPANVKGGWVGRGFGRVSSISEGDQRPGSTFVGVEPRFVDRDGSERLEIDEVRGISSISGA